MVGGLADWFAVTALFRRPLGLPIPHTAIVVERKDRFAATLGEFVLETFLTPAVIAERLRAVRPVERAADWLAEPANAARAAAEMLEVLGQLGMATQRDAARKVIADLARAGIEAIPLAPLGGRLLRILATDRRLDDALAAALQGLEGYLDAQREELRERLGARAPWWLPSAIEGRLFDSVFAEVRAWIGEAARDPEHPLRLEARRQLIQLAEQLEHSEAMRARGEDLKRELLVRAELQAWLDDLIDRALERLSGEASGGASSLPGLLADAFTAGARRIQQDAAIRGAVEARLDGVVRYGARRFERELAELVTHTIASWDARETASRLELLLGPDLQYVRMSGTIIGAVAGFAIHGVAEVLQ